MKQALPTAVLRWRYAVLAVWSAGWAALLAAQWDPRAFGFNDWTVFRLAGRLLIGRDGYDPGPGGALHMYANLPKLQIGPPAVVASLPFDLLPAVPGAYAAVAAMTALGLLVVLAGERLGRVLVPGRDTAALTLVGGLLVLPAWTVLSALSMHLDDLLVLLLLAGAMLATAHPRPVVVAVLLGIAIAAKPWALVLLPVVWGLPRVHRAAAVLGALVVAALCWSPFLIAAPDTVSALGGVRLPVAADSALRLIGVAAGDDAPGGLRAVQLVLAVGAGVWVARRGRWYAVPLAAIAVRVALDPQTYAYYAAALVVAAFLCDAARRVPPFLTAGALAVAFVPMLLADAVPSIAAGLRIAGCVLLIVAAAAPDRFDLARRTVSRERAPASTP